jgi:hypothetical protein
MKPTPKGLTYALPLIPTCRFAHLCRSLPSGSIPAESIQRVCHDTAEFIHVPAFPNAIETRSLPTLTRSYPRRFTFYVAWPAAPFARLTHSRRNVVQR